MEYRLTDQQIRDAIYSHKEKGCPPWPEVLYPRDRMVADAASKKARNQTLKEVRDWLEACGLGIAEYTYINGSKGSRLKDKSMGIVYIPRTDDPNRFFPKDAP